MDEVFVEEKKNLSNIEMQIDSLASGYENEANSIRREISDFIAVDYNDRIERRDLRARAASAQEKATQLRSYQDSPYFGRMDLDWHHSSDSEYQTDTFFIGKEGISEGARQIVIDWRSPVGSFFYMKNQKHFSCDEFQYQLALRRALTIEKGKLISYHTEYDGEDITLEGDVVDPFLITVLKDKRRHNTLTDIIRTIQGNQNEIIRSPRDKSFIVQGCAGSGKTMILLHRLSFLAYNNRAMNMDNVKILTPNKYFGMYINQLSTQLGLDKIERLTVEEFYVSLLKKYFRKSDADALVESEKTLNADLLAELYSEEYKRHECERYEEYWSKALASLSEQGFFELVKRRGINEVALTTHKHSDYLSLSSYLTTLRQKRDKALSDKEVSLGLLTRLRNEHQALTIKEPIAERTFLEKKAAVRGVLLTKAKQLEGTLKEDEEALAAQAKKITEIEEEFSKITQERSAADAVLANWEQIRQGGLSAKKISLLSTAEGDELVRAFRSDFTDLEEKKTELESVPFFNFSKRNALVREYSQQEAALSARLSSYVIEKIAQLNEEYQATKHNGDEVYRRLTRNGEVLSRLSQKREEASAQKEELNSMLAMLERDLVFRDFAISPVAAVFSEEDVQAIEDYNKTCAILDAVRTEKGKKEVAILRREEEQERLEKLVFTPDEENLLSFAGGIISKLQFGEITRNILYRDLMLLHQKYHANYKKENYRYRLYLRLLFSWLYFEKLGGLPNYINIDEAQDIAPAEYTLLRSILGDTCVFNLYGDVNQLVYSYKGISDWNDIKSIIGEQMYVLNENYRNTSEITKFCNKEFGAEVYPIGISGPEVQELTLAEAIKAIIASHRADPEKRIAVIYRRGIESIMRALRELFGASPVSWDRVDDGQISVISVETAKGLEFDQVVAITSQMTNNEKYISFTRALDELITVREEFAANIEEVYQEETLEGEDEDHDFEIMTEVPEEDSEESSREEFVSEEEVSLRQKYVPQTIQSEDENATIAAFEGQISELISRDIHFENEQRDVFTYLLRGESVYYVAPTGHFKSAITCLLSKFFFEEAGKQTLVIAESHLQENILVAAERFGLRVGTVGDGMQVFLHDFQKEKYGLIFVPSELLSSEEEVSQMAAYFSGRVSFVAVDHLPVLQQTLGESLAKRIGAPIYLMSKEKKEDLENFGHRVVISCDEKEKVEYERYTFISDEGKLSWIRENVGRLFGQGLIYCETTDTAKAIRKTLQKARVQSEVFSEEASAELLNYLSGVFTRGDMPILISTQQIGKDLSNPAIRFVLHFDIPENQALHELHMGQIGSMAEAPVTIDFAVLQ